jgi:hypothetical protein
MPLKSFITFGPGDKRERPEKGLNKIKHFNLDKIMKLTKHEFIKRVYDFEHKDTLQNDTQHYDISHNGTQHNGIMPLSIMALSVIDTA